ncbi:MAG: 23S rRNA (pseudouridine(1915)-N(3))-methyltransferase RlmH [Sutterella sp.]|nr:23S rRNA (pseudouridine(1915)-N(3))-methyltransferase RlmH [Sutterella sp.]
MRIKIIAVGQHIAEWARIATQDYLGRFPRDFSVELKEVRTEHRSGLPPAKLMQAEAERILSHIEPGEYVIALDEHGRTLTTMEFAQSLSRWRNEAFDLVFIIGGPDGLAPSVKEVANESLRLSSMTLPHALARVLLAEQLYRAWSILAKHPYHRS